jgi:hypothetical protein
MALSMNIDDEWDNFMSSSNCEDVDIEDDDSSDNEILSNNITNEMCPKASPIYISTKTNIAFLNKPIDLKRVFWLIPIINYAHPKPGIVKKQMKINSFTPEELEEVNEKLKHEVYVEDNVITSINNPSGRIKFKDIRKVGVGICKKDLVSYRCKQKSAFYNCFVLILRLNISGEFKEFHAKVFNTGKLEIPGIQTDAAFHQILDMVIATLQPHMEDDGVPLQCKNDSIDTVLINSNFNCGFYINRETLFETLKFKYNIQCIYDPCSYPGIQCKFYYDKDTGIKSAETEKTDNAFPVSFMVFRTGSVLIVGKCDESVLHVIYEYLKDLLSKEFTSIMLKLSDANAVKDKKKKVRRKQIVVSASS